ncbi:MAG: DoxX family membrane protein, partial [Acidimicrobiia bacterium]|nr:DoxX family membrane protein [Acidimicrobiia bacterium]
SELPLMGSVSALLLACVFTLAAVGKVRDPEGTRQGFADLGMPRAAELAWLVPITEIAVAALLVLVPGWGGVAGFGLLMAFTVVLVVTVRSGRPVPCRCFGGTSTDPVSWGQVTRNVWLLCHAVVASLTSSLSWPSVPEFALAAATIGVGPIAVALVENRFTVPA